MEEKVKINNNQKKNPILSMKRKKNKIKKN